MADPFGAAVAPGSIPLSVITGFLGSGKTTLLARLLRQPGMAGSAVIINELGEVGLDHLLVQRIEGEVCLLQSGCVCCSLRGDLELALQQLLARRERNEIPRFDRVLVETTGMADPAPILQLLQVSAMARRCFHLGSVITTVDAINGCRQLDEHPEAARQVALADRILVTKTDLADESSLAPLDERIEALNPGAPRHRVRHGEVEAALLFAPPDADADDAQGERPARMRTLPPGDRVLGCGRASMALPGGMRRHLHGIDHFQLTLDVPLDWTAFAEWMTDFVARHGDKLLRVKGILDVQGEARPVAIHGIHHTFHPPSALAAWPGGARRSRLVFVTRGLGKDEVERDLMACVWPSTMGSDDPPAG